MLATRMKISTWEPKPFPIVEAVNANASAGSSTGSINVALPAGIVAGELLIIAVCTGTIDPVFATPSGWSQLFQEGTGTGGTANACKMAVFWRVADGSEGSKVNVTNAPVSRKTALSARISGAQSIEATVLGGSSMTPEPPPLAPSWPRTSTMFLTLAAISPPNSSFVAAPAGYTVEVTSATSATSGFAAECQLASLDTLVPAESESPGPFTIADPVYWIAATLGVRPTQ